MSIAGPVEQASPGQKATRPRTITRRSVLGAAVGAGTSVAAIRLLGIGQAELQRLEGLLPGVHATSHGAGDWISPLGKESAKVAHLLRRAQFGATAQEFEKAASEGFKRTIDRLLETSAAPPPPLAAAADAAKGSRINPAQLQQWWVDWILTSPSPFAERMTLFWHNHFTSDYRKVGAQTPFIYWQNLTWRDMALGDLRTMLMRVTTDPAMLRYLDLATSTGSNPNENYSRELMELFTMGPGNYTEDDVRAAAKALSGWTEPRPSSTVDVMVDAKNKVTQKFGVYGAPSTGVFVPSRAYRGSLTFLRQTGAFDAQRVIDAILAQPATAPFIAAKFAAHFVSARVDSAYIKRLGDKFRASRYDVKTLLRALFTSPEFLADQSYRALVKSPIEYMAHALKVLNAPELSRLVVQNAANMGQVLFDPPDVGGWPNNEAWISSNTVIARVNFVTSALAALKSLPPASDAHIHIDSVLSPQTASLLNQATDDRTRWLLILASPEFQLK